MFQAVLFELEGVLADTRNLRRRALQDALAHDGVVLTDDDYDDLYATLPVRSAIPAALGAAGATADATAIELATLRAERGFADQLSHGFAITDGARELVASLAARVRLGIVTRASRRDAASMLTTAGLDFAFEFVVSADDIAEPKPATAPYEHALRALARRRAIAPPLALALEDGPAGIRSARGAGLRCLAVGPMPAHWAMQAEGLLPTLRGHTLASLEGVVLRPEERIA
jgi:beta-phosphoglucomutase-like phosphatase (HAD superfamily)